MRHPAIRTVFVLVVSSLLAVPTMVSGQTVITRGEAISGSPVVDLVQALGSVDQYADQTVVVEGAVKKVCQMKGCWMELTSAGADRGVRVTFKDYAFLFRLIRLDTTRDLRARLKKIFFQKVTQTTSLPKVLHYREIPMAQQQKSVLSRRPSSFGSK